MNKLIYTIFLLTAVSLNAKELIVIHDSGNTLPIAPYLPQSITKIKKPTNQTPRLPFQLPITTPSMELGKVITTARTLRYLQRPLFLVGSDSTSRAWLKERREQLIQISAVGILIEAKHIKDIEGVLKLANGLRIIPASGEAIAKELSIKHYPILISREGWEQ